MRYAASGDPAIVARFDQICDDYDAREAKWVEWLRAYGIKAAHPDDGWVDRSGKYHTVQFVYPQFDDGVAEGDLICLGWHDRFRVVKVRRILKQIFSGVRYEVA